MELINKGVRGLDTTDELLKVSIIQNWLGVRQGSDTSGLIGVHPELCLLLALVPSYGDSHIVPLLLQDDARL